jgi:hypothetical protein
LWVAVFVDAFLTVRDGEDRSSVALAWRFINESPIIETLGYELGLEPGELKRLVLEALGPGDPCR